MNTTSNGTVAVKNLTKRFGDVTAVNNLTFEVSRGELLCLLGPSGCGKTTLLRMLAGLLEPTSGEIFMGGRCVYSSTKGIFVPPAKRGLGMMFQNYALWPHMSVRENISYGLKTGRVPKGEAATRLNTAADMMGIANLLDRFPTELSGGQQQRVALARMVVVEPEVFLMDEPLSNLDAKLRVHTRVELRRIQQSLDISGVYVTHDQEEALALADQIAVMNDGNILHLGSPEDVYENSSHLFVSGFLGSPPPNMIGGTLAQAAGVTEVTIPNFGPISVGRRPHEAPADNRVTVALRPEYLTLHSSDAAAAGLLVSNDLKVVSSQFMGTHYVILAAGGDAEPLYLRREKGSDPVTVGDRIRIAIEHRHIRVYEAASGRLLGFEA